jgi:NADH/NAD ratio-sensing transcriptional regulator Rex
MSGQSEAVAALRALEERVRDDPSETGELRVHVREAQRLCDRVVREGPDQVFGSAAVP